MPLHYSEFSQRIRDKFRNASGQSPYDGIPDDVLADKFVKKFPQYQSEVDWGMDYAGRVSRAASVPQAALPGGRITQAPAIGVFADPVSPESMGAPAMPMASAPAATPRPVIASESTSVRVSAPVASAPVASAAWRDEQARRAQMAQPTLSLGEQRAKEERDLVAADEAEYQKYIADYNALWEADKKNRTGRAILDYRLSSGKRPLMRDEFARARAGYSVPEAWMPTDLAAGATRDRTAMQTLGEVSEFAGRTVMNPVTRAIDAVAGVQPGFSDLSHASNVRRNFEVQAKVRDLRNAEKTSGLTEGEKQYLAENDPGMVSETIQAVKDLPGMVGELAANPEARRQFAVGMATDLPGSLAVSGGASLALDAMKGAKAAMKLRNVRKSFEGRAAAGTITAEQAARATARKIQMIDGEKAIEEMYDLVRKNPGMAEGILRETIGDGLADAVVETLNGQGRGEQTGVVANLISGMPLDIVPYFTINTAKRMADRVVNGPDNGLTRPQFDAAMQAMDFAAPVRNSDGLPVVAGKVFDENGNIVHNEKGYAQTQKAGTTAIRPQVEDAMRRIDLKDNLKQISDLAKSPETSDMRYRLTNEDLKVDMTPEELAQASYGGRDDGAQTVRGFAQSVPDARLQYEPGATMKDYSEGRVPLKTGERTVAVIGRQGDQNTVAHETIHGIENKLRAEGYGNNPSPESARLVDMVDDWTDRAYEWGRKNEVLLPGPKELLTQAMTYRLGWGNDFDPIIRELPVPDELVKAFAERSGRAMRGDYGLRTEGTRMSDLPAPERPEQQQVAAAKEYVPDADLGFSLSGNGDKLSDQDRPRLRVTHNLDEEKLRMVDALGGFARPWKPTRAVYFDEFGAAVVPDDVDQATIDLLHRRGITRIEKYKRGDVEDRTQALNKFPDLQFSLASEAGVPEGRADDPKVVEAARKAWREKGVESPWFKRWFGDSKVVDENGKPLVVYHGTSADFNEFSADKIGSNFGDSMGASNNTNDGGFFFTSRKSTAESFAAGAGDSPRVIEAYLNLRNPYIEDVGDYWDASFKVDHANFKNLREKGYDGMIVSSPNGSLFVAFSPEQIKSATGNRGTFDGGNSDIRYALSKDDPRQKILTHVTKSMRENGLKSMAQNDMSSEWRTYSKKAKSDPAQLAKEEKAWDAVEGSLRQYVADNPTIAAEAGLTPITEGNLDQFDLANAVDQFRVWTNSKTQGKYSREELDHFAQAMDAAKSGPGSSGMEMSRRPMSWLSKSKENRSGSSILFDSMGERFVAKWNGKEGVWNVRHPKSGDSFTVPRDGAVWVDGAIVKGPQFDDSAYPLRDDRKLSAANAEQQSIGEGDLAKSEAEESRVDALARHVQDSMRDLRVLQDRVSQKGADPYREYDLAAGRGDHSGAQMRERFLSPILKVMKTHGLDQATVDSYLYARHAAERNATIAGKNPDMPDGGSGMSTKEAERILSNFAQDAVRNKALEAIGTMNDKLNAWRSEMLVKSGLLSESDEKSMQDSWKHYVPLRGIPGDENASSGVFRGKVAAQDKKKALGRKSKAESVLAQNFAVTLDAIINSQRNIAARELWKLAQSNPDAKYWELDTSYVRNVQGKDGQVTQMADIQRMQKAPGIVPVYIKGEPHYIEFKTPEGARIAAAIKELNQEQSNTLIRGLGKVNRFVGSMITQYSPEFVLTNFSRDYLTALTVSYARDGVKIAKRMIKDAPAAVVGLARDEAGMKNEWGEWKSRWASAGGKVGFTQAKDFKTLADDIENDLKDLQRSNYNPKKWANVVGKVVEAANGSVESATRLAYFRALVENGVSESVAAQKSKELTVNFNRRGDWKWANQFWMFFNASVQGSANIAKLFTDKDPAVRKRAYAAAGAIASAGAAVALYNQFLGGEDEDSGKTHYERLPGWAKGNSAIIMDPVSKNGNAVTIPLPYGLNVIWNMGRMMAEGASRKDGFTAMDAASEIAGSIVGSFSPFGADIDPGNIPGTVLGLATPTAAKPWSELALNKNFSGRPIMPENIPGMTNKPESELYYPGVNPYAREMSAFLNEKTGGDKWHAGAVSVSPEKMEHVFNAYTGGVGRMLQQGFGIAKDWGEGKETTIRQWPFARRFLSTPPEGIDRAAFMDEVLTPAKQDMQQLKDMAKEDVPGLDSFVDDHYSNIVASAAFGGLKTKEKRLKRAEELGSKIGSSGVKDEYKEFFAKAWKAKRAMDDLQDQHNATTDEAKRNELRKQIENEAEKAFEGFAK